MARYIISYRISRYWGRIVAYLYRDNYPSNEVDIPVQLSVAVAVNAVGDIDKGSLMQHSRSRQSDTNWQ